MVFLLSSLGLSLFSILKLFHLHLSFTNYSERLQNFLCIRYKYAFAFDEVPILISSIRNKHYFFEGRCDINSIEVRFICVHNILNIEISVYEHSRNQRRGTLIR